MKPVRNSRRRDTLNPVWEPLSMLAILRCCWISTFRAFLLAREMSLMEIPQFHSSRPEDHAREDHPHIVRFYSDDEALVREVTRIMSAALNRGEPAIAIATRSHCEEVAQELKREVRNFPRAAA